MESIEERMEELKPYLGESWTYTVLEIFEPTDGWPKEGRPADWIDDDKILYCQAEAPELVASVPLYLLLTWKFTYWVSTLWEELCWQWRWTFRRTEVEEKLARFEELMAEARKLYDAPPRETDEGTTGPGAGSA